MKMTQLLNLIQKLLKQISEYSDAYILVTGDIASVNGNQNTSIAFKNCAPFTRCVTYLNDEHVETAENLDIIINMYNLLFCRIFRKFMELQKRYTKYH